jgi:hypothetical protein
MVQFSETGEIKRQKDISQSHLICKYAFKFQQKPLTYDYSTYLLLAPDFKTPFSKILLFVVF